MKSLSIKSNETLEVLSLLVSLRIFILCYSVLFYKCLIYNYAVNTVVTHIKGKTFSFLCCYSG